VVITSELTWSLNISVDVVFTKNFQEYELDKHIFIKHCWFLNCLGQKGTIPKFTTSENILNYTLSSYSFSSVMNILNRGLVEIIAVNVLSQYFLTVWIYESFLYYNFIAICPSSTQRFIFISSATVQYTGSNFIFLFLGHAQPKHFMTL
jgi:hypothetical protein